MKPAVANYERRIFALRIESTNGVDVVRFVSYPHDLVMGGETYQSDLGYELTDYSATSSASPAVLDLQGILDAAGVDRASIVSGTWDNAKVKVFATDWANPVEDEEPIALFLFGKTSLRDDRYVIECMQLIDAINQSVGRTHGPLCPWTLFDENIDGTEFSESKCGLDIDDYIETGTLTAVTSNLVFRDSSRGEAADYFAVGAIRFTTGNNAGLKSQEIKSYAADGTITLFQPFPSAVQVGDQYEIVPGCRKRLEDCRDKFSNVLNFGGFPNMITQSQYQQIGGQ
jgi:uncharacterized phage protein (TIGR02218 family)